MDRISDFASHKEQKNFDIHVCRTRTQTMHFQCVICFQYLWKHDKKYSDIVVIDMRMFVHVV